MNPYIEELQPINIITEVADNIKICNDLLSTKGGKCRFTIFHNNIRSLAKNKDELNITLDQIHTKFDCIVLTETFLLENPEYHKMDGYSSIYNEGTINKNDGTIVYIKSTHNFKHKIVNIECINMIVSVAEKTIEI